MATFESLFIFITSDLFDFADDAILKSIHSKICSYVDKSFSKAMSDICDDDIMANYVNKIHSLLKQNFMCNLECTDIISSIDDELTYVKDLDKVCLIFDRDKSSLTKERFLGVIKNAKKMQIETYVTNPCFEFWLFLHHNKRTTKNERASLLSNKYYSTRKKERFSTHILKTVDPSFSKSGPLNPIFYKRYDKAIRASRSYETDIDKLENRIGSNLPFLFQKYKK